MADNELVLRTLSRRGDNPGAPRPRCRHRRRAGLKGR
jgi:hypothetical protein